MLTAPIAAEPRTLNPLVATDAASRTAIGLIMADLMHINAATQQVQPALATAVEHSADGLRWTIHLRHNVRFSDGHPFTAADVIFTFTVYEDAQSGAPQRDLLMVDGKPIVARAIDDYTVRLHLPGPYAAGDRLFDSLWMLPQHRLEAAYKSGQLGQVWSLATPPGDIVGLGPFALEAYAAGRQLTFRRNEYYWKQDAAGRRLPYLDQVRLLEVPDPNTRTVLFSRGQLDVLESVPADDFARLAADSRLKMSDAGAALEPVALAFNCNEAITSADLRRRVGWFSDVEFRRALALAIDRANLVRNVYGGRAAAIDTLTSPAERDWASPIVDEAMNFQERKPGYRSTSYDTTEGRDPAALAREALLAHGFRFDGERLSDRDGHPVAFSLIVPSTNAARMRMAVFLQQDLRSIGIALQVVPLDFASFADRLLHRKDYDAALMAFGFPDADPNVESAIWTSDGGMHLWHLHPQKLEPWEVELDRKFREQMIALKPARRRALYRGIQRIEREDLPMIPLVTPDVLTGSSAGLLNVHPAVLAPHLLWNVEQLSWRKGWQ